MSTLDLIAAERTAMADEFSALSAEQLSVASLCGAWTVHDIAAHLYSPLFAGRPLLLRLLVQSRGNFDKLNQLLTAHYARLPLASLADGLRTQARNPFRPPGYGHVAQLTDSVVHGEDFRRPLGLAHDFDPVALKSVLEFLVSDKARRIFRQGRSLDGIRLHATDLDWSSGSGALVEGRAIDLILALSGRRIALVDLSGEGVSRLG